MFFLEEKMFTRYFKNFISIIVLIAVLVLQGINVVAAAKASPDQDSNKVILSVKSGAYEKLLSISFTVTKGFKAYYTLDGSIPTINKNKYSTAIQIGKSTTLKYIWVDSKGKASTVKTAIYKLNIKAAHDFLTVMKDRPTGNEAEGLISDLNKAVSIKNKIYMINNDGTVLEYDPVPDIWTEKGKIEEITKSEGDFKLTAANDMIYITTYYALLEYDISTNHCSIKAILPNIGYTATIAAGDQIFLLGGLEEDEHEIVYTNSVYTYDLKNNKLIQKNDLINVTCDSMVTSLNGKIYFLDGPLEDKGQNFEEYDNATDTWEMIDPCPDEWFGAGLAVVDNKLYVFPDYYNFMGQADNIKQYDPATGKWLNKSVMNFPKETPSYTTVVCNGEVYIISGTSVRKYTP
jgi:hypothetical protein